MIETILMTVSGSVMALLGAAHLLLTFVGPKLQPRDPELKVLMERSSPAITRQTTMWRAWIGFNASHSIGALLFGFVYGYLALAHAELLFSSTPLLVIGLATLVGYLVLAIRYWFINPIIGIGISLCCFVASVGLTWA